MSHGIMKNDTMFSVKERPWHGLGTVLENAPSVKEAIILAGLNWEVEKRPIKTDEENSLVIPGKQAIVRKDINSVLGVVGTNYKPLQNSEAFDWFEPFVENGLATLETAGSLYDGKRVFILAKLALDNLDIMNEDPIESFILLSNAHDGSMAVRVGFTPIRVVCNNTLSCAHNSDASKLIRVHHTGDVNQILIELRETMDLVNQQFISTAEYYRKLARKDINASDLAKYVKQVFNRKSLEATLNETPDMLDEEQSRKQLIARIEEIFETKEKYHTAWNAYNAVNTYLVHERGRTLDAMYNSTWFGMNKQFDRKALQLAAKL